MAIGDSCKMPLLLSWESSDTDTVLSPKRYSSFEPNGAQQRKKYHNPANILKLTLGKKLKGRKCQSKRE